MLFLYLVHFQLNEILHLLKSFARLSKFLKRINEEGALKFCSIKVKMLLVLSTALYF